MKVYYVSRRLRVGDQEVTVPIGVFSDKEEAQRIAGKLHEAQAGMLKCSLVNVNAKGEGEDSGIKLGQYLADIGVHGFIPQITELEVQGQRVELASSMPKGKLWPS